MAETLTSTLFLPMLKRLYHEGRIADLVYRTQPFLGMLKKNTNFFGEGKYITVKYGDVQGRSRTFSKVTGSTNNTHASRRARFFLERKFDYAVATVDGDVIESSMNNMGALAGALDTEVKSMLATLSYNLGRAVVGDSGDARGQISAGTAPQVPGGGADDYIDLLDTAAVKHFEVGQTLTCGTTDGTSSGTVRSTPATAQITKVDRKLGRIMFAASTFSGTNWAVSDYLFTDGDADSSNLGDGLHGLQDWIPATVASSGDSFLSVDRYVDRDRLAGIYRDYSSSTLVTAIDKLTVDIQEAGGMPSHCWTSPKTLQNIRTELGARAEFDTVKAFAGPANVTFKALVLPTGSGDVKLMADRNFPDNEAFVLSMDDWDLWTLGAAPKIIQHDGMKTLRQAESDGVEFRGKVSGNLRCKAPGHSGRTLLAS